MSDTSEPSRIVLAKIRLSELTWGNFSTARTLGFALMRGWVYLMFLGTATSSITWNGQAIPGIVFMASTVALVVILFASALFHKQFELLMMRAWFRVLGPTLTTLGTLCISTMTLPGTPEILLGSSGAVITGIGSGLIDLGYGGVYRNIDPTYTSFEVPFAFFIAAVLFPIVLSLPPIAACVITATLPLISGWILFWRLKVWPPDTAQQVKPVEIKLGKFAWKIGACACLIGLADGVVRSVFINTSGTSTEDFYRFPLVWASIGTMAIIYLCVLFSRQQGLPSVYRAVMLVMAVFFMLLPIFTEYTQIESVIALTGYGTFNVLIWMLLASISFTYRFSSVMVFGIGWGMISLGVLLGSLVASFITVFAPFSPQTLSLIALLATLAILLSYMFVFSESDLIALSIADDEADESEKSSIRRRPFQERCQEVAMEYGLSPKETEIMILFAKGRSSARIQEELYLSRGTVTTHLRHIYSKMDVHDKQEFLDVIEGRREE